MILNSLPVVGLVVLVNATVATSTTPGPFWPELQPKPVLPRHSATVKVFVPKTVLVRFIPTGFRTLGSAFTKISNPLVGSEPWMFTAIWICVPFKAETAMGEMGHVVERGSDTQTVPINWPRTGGNDP